MFDIFVTEPQINYAKELIENYDFGMRGYGDGSKQEQFTGMVGQTVLADLLGINRPTGDSGFDGGFDFIINNKRVDVKTMSRTTPMRDYYVHNFCAYQINYEVNYYIFASFNTTNNVLTVCGCIDKANFQQRAKFFPKGALRYRSDGTSFETKAPLYEIGQTQIYYVDGVERIKKIII